MNAAENQPKVVVVPRVDPEVVRKLKGKYRHLATETVDEGRRAAREEQAEREDQRNRSVRLRPNSRIDKS